MSEGQTIKTRPASETQEKPGGAVRSSAAMRPTADVFEDADGITLHLDMPGVSRDRLSVHADQNTLTVEGSVQITMPEGMDALYAEVHSTVFRRSFALSGELDAEHAAAIIKDGVLTLRIPKRSELRPRRIEVRVV
jgi:HSP20 family protein